MPPRFQVLPDPKEASDVDTDGNVLDENDVRVEVMRARGAGGQVCALCNHSTSDTYASVARQQN